MNFVIIQTNSWIRPNDNDNAWGLHCTKCNKTVCIGYTKTELNNMNMEDYNCSMCNDSGAVITGCSEDGHTIYSECPCISDKRTLAKQIVKTVNELFHFQETQDWEEKAINEVLKYI